MDLDDLFDQVEASISSIQAYAAQRQDDDLTELVEDLSERYKKLDAFTSKLAFVEIESGTEH